MNNTTLNKKIKLLQHPTTVLNYYKKTGLLVPIGISCTWKCPYCINKQHESEYKIKEYEIKKIIELYEINPFVESLIFAGLEPLDNPHDLKLLIDVFRQYFQDDIVIYTGYDSEDLDINKDLISIISEIHRIDNIIIKYGRYIADRKRIFNNILGIELASDNQWAFKSNWV